LEATLRTRWSRVVMTSILMGLVAGAPAALRWQAPQPPKKP
jgi:hypothetical protein